MKLLKHFLIALLTASICIFLSPVFAINLPENPQAQNLYQAGKYAEAVNILKQAIARFQSNGDKLNEAMALSNLSLAYQQLGQWSEAETTITQSLNLLSKINTSESSQIFAQALDIQGRLQLSQGNTEAALNSWQSAAKIYQQLKDDESLTRNQINQAQAMQTLGLYLQADKTLISVAESLSKLPDSTVKATGFLSLGNIRRLVGDFEKSQKFLKEGLEVAERVQSEQIKSDILLSLGNTFRSQRNIQINLDNKENQEDTKKHTKDAIQYYQQATNQSATPTTRINAQLNLLSLFIEEKNWDKVSTLLPQIKSQLADLPVSRTSVYAKINFAQSLIKYADNKSSTLQPAAEILTQAVQQAQSLKDQRAESYALGTMGELYQKTGDFVQAEKLIQQALSIAQSINARDIAYQWLWHLGGILEKQGDGKSASAAYEQAWKILTDLRTDLVAMNQNTQFSFRENVEPVYRDFVDLLLRDTNSQESNLTRAREVIESLQIAEIDNFLRSPCSRPTTAIDKLVENDKSTAVIYPIILDQRLEVIVKLPGTEIRHYTTAIPQNEVEDTVNKLKDSLIFISQNIQITDFSGKIYDWLIRPTASELDKNQIKTLVFVLDGSLRNIPMSVLYDKEQQKYLIQKYALALATGLELVEPKPLKNVKLNALLGGVGAENPVAGTIFTPLENVKGELEEIRTQIPQSQELFNEKLTKTNLEQQVKSHPFSVVHLATHGQFSSNPEQTYIVIWNDLLKINELDNLLRTRDNTKPESIELLVLSACKTAKGDKQAALGLAGIAVKSGARSTLASLWVADDSSARQLISEFYKQLNKGVTKAEALQRAQLSLFTQEKDNPYIWAPYVLVGNWL
ncbi:CHAT domain-containing protein [Desmonostoc muscorum LEGE 12446]|uniref:CHAT domain-containing protein n=1 Tax=Desmonostoc muscorum LEGE 12446 TaxID=1828758 RepID=A0A8J6ZLK1_DESMC|nr:CHAT domain-containing protein [Desmonostoc muscorum]MCF2147610.1 CHAT domain-containing protein [Desmonostoc muscorum LEGE 12446]